MAKAAVKATKEKEAPKKAASKAAPKTTAKAKPSLEKVAQDTLNKFAALKLDAQLQADLEWCIGSYLHDGNPSGVVEQLERAIGVLKTELARKTKGVTTKLVTDLEKALAK